MPLISVAGVMGVGKSTVAAKLAEVFDCKLIAEEHRTLCRKRFFHEPERWALAHQCEYVLRNGNNFTTALANANRELFVSDYLLSLSRAYSLNTMETREFAIFNDMFQRLAGTAWAPDLIIYLTRPTNSTLARIQQRSRSNEDKVTFLFLGNLEKDIEKIIIRHEGLGKTGVPVARFGRSDEKDFDIDQIVEMIGFCKQHGFDTDAFL